MAITPSLRSEVRATVSEANAFELTGGTLVGYVSGTPKARQCEEAAQIIGNRFSEITGANNGLYVTVRNGSIANNVFSNIACVALILNTNSVPSDTCDNLSISGNAFYRCKGGIRSDFGGGALVSEANLSIVGNVFEGGGPAAAIGLYPCSVVPVTGNVIRNWATDHSVVQLLSASDSIFSGNVIEWNNGVVAKCWALLFGTYAGNVVNVVIDGNIINGCENGIIGGADPGRSYAFMGIQRFQTTSSAARPALGPTMQPSKLINIVRNRGNHPK